MGQRVIKATSTPRSLSLESTVMPSGFNGQTHSNMFEPVDVVFRTYTSFETLSQKLMYYQVGEPYWQAGGCKSL